MGRFHLVKRGSVKNDIFFAKRNNIAFLDEND